ncbi:MAG: hypothetical protein RIQ93_1543 [Verrucomicrobiota bacterium]
MSRRLLCFAFTALLLIPGIGRAQDGAQRWAFSTLTSSNPGNILSSPAAGPDGTIYIGTEVGTSTSSNPSGRLWAIRPDGSVKWSFTTPDWIDSAPVVGAEGTIYFGCWDGNVYALNPDGSRKWAVNAGSFVSASPAIAADGTLYVGSGDGNLYAITPAGMVKWIFPTADFIDSSPAIGPDGVIYFGGWDNAVYAVRPDGSQKWRYTTGGEVTSSPAVAQDGTIYIGSRDLTLYAFSSSGELKWSRGLGDTIEASPVIGSDGTVYIPTTGGRMYAFDADGTERWRYPGTGQAALNPIYSSPAIRSDGSILFGTSNNALCALRADGTLLWRSTLGDWTDSSPLVTADGVIYIGCADKKLYSFFGNGLTLDAAAPWPAFRRNSGRSGRAAIVTVDQTPAAQSVAVGSLLNMAAAGHAESDAPAVTYQWLVNGIGLPGATASSLQRLNFQPALAGLYTVQIANSAGAATSPPAIIALASAIKLTGPGMEYPDIPHPIGRIYDQILLQGAAATLTADPGQVTRISYVDLTNDIVQVEFSGAGSVSVVLQGAAGPAAALNYNQPGTEYMKGHAGIVITGADETSHLSVFTVGKITAVNQSLFRSDVAYDGVADIAFVAILSRNGRFGSIRTANASYVGTSGHVGIYAPGVQINGPVYVGDIHAAGSAIPVLIIGGASATQINGGNLFQQNGQAVRVGGLSQLQFVAGSTSHGVALPAQLNQAQLEQDGADVTRALVLNPR